MSKIHARRPTKAFPGTCDESVPRTLLESLYDQFPWLENNSSCTFQSVYENVKTVTTNRMKNRFFLRVLGAVGILIYVGIKCLAR